MSQPEPVIWHLSPPVASSPTSDRDLRQSYLSATGEAEEMRLRGTRERLHTLGIATAVCTGLILNRSDIVQGFEIGVASLRGLGGLL